MFSMITGIRHRRKNKRWWEKKDTDVRDKDARKMRLSKNTSVLNMIWTVNTQKALTICLPLKKKKGILAWSNQSWETITNPAAMSASSA